MTEIDPSLILKDGDCIYFHGEKYQKVVEPKSFYDKLWEELGKKVGYGIGYDIGAGDEYDRGYIDGVESVRFGVLGD